MASQLNESGINTGIPWCDYTLNLWWGCTEVHEGCDNCYARVLAHRWGFEVWGAKGVRRFIKSWQKTLNKYQREAEKAGAIRTVFVGSMMDIFEKPMPLVSDDGSPAIDYSDGSPICTDWPREELFDAISAGKYPNLLFLLLTKRPGNINKNIPEAWRINGAPANIMFGTSVVNQQTADKLIPQLLKVNGRRFLSMEPLLGPVDLSNMDVEKAGDKDWCWINPLSGRHRDMGRACPDVPTIEWVIVGGESGHKARPMNAEWCFNIMEECKAAGVKFHMKQGSQSNWPDFKNIASFPAELQVRHYANNSNNWPTVAAQPLTLA